MIDKDKKDYTEWRARVRFEVDDVGGKYVLDWRGRDRKVYSRARIS